MTKRMSLDEEGADLRAELAAINAEAVKLRGWITDAEQAAGRLQRERDKAGRDLAAAQNMLSITLNGDRDLVEKATAPLRAELAAAKAERDIARARYDRAVKILLAIHATLSPPRIKLDDGRVMEFKNAEIEHRMLHALSDRIRAIPDEIAAIDAAIAGSKT